MRYWVNLGHWDTDDLDPGLDDYEDLVEKYEEAKEELRPVSSDIAPYSGLVYKTTDREDAEEVLKEAQKIISRIFGEKADRYLQSIDIAHQPECPECGKWGRFSDSYCPRCGVKMVR